MDIGLLTSSKYPEADSIAGENYGKYDTVLYNFLTNSAELLPYILISYPYIFTGNYTFSWMEQININKYIKLSYKPSVPKYFYTYNEIYKLFLAEHHQKSKINKVLCIGNEHGFIESLDYLQVLKPYTQIKFIGTKKSAVSFREYLDKTHEFAAEWKTTISISDNLSARLYDILDDQKLGRNKYNLVLFNYYTYINGIDFNFAFLQTTTNFVAMILALQTLALGGSFVFHMYAIINKSSADVFVILKQYFTSAELYFPECANEYYSTGTWAILTGFKGISKGELDKLISILQQIKQIYPNGLNDVNIYDQHIREKCWVTKKPDNSLPHEYITGYLNIPSTDAIYDVIREFNTGLYELKYNFTNRVYKLWSTAKKPNISLLPTREQMRASDIYLKKWGYKYSITNNFGNEPRLDDIFSRRYLLTLQRRPRYTYFVRSAILDEKMIDAEFQKRGNWIKYDLPTGGNKKATRPPDFVYLDGSYSDSSRFRNIKCGLTNRNDSEVVGINLDTLYPNLVKIPGSDSFLPWRISFTILGQEPGFLESFRKYFGTGTNKSGELGNRTRVFICRPMGLSADTENTKNIIITNDFTEFQKFMSRYFDNRQNRPSTATMVGQYKDWVLEEYITNPHLIDGHRFNIQIMLICQPGTKKSSYYNTYYSRLGLAPEPMTTNWTNNNTQFVDFNNPPSYNWPYDFPISNATLRDIYKQYEFIFASIISSMPQKCQPGVDACFSVVWVNLLITDDMQVKLVGATDKVGFNIGNNYFKARMFKSILKLIVDDYYPPENLQIRHGQFYPIPRINSKTGAITNIRSSRKAYWNRTKKHKKQENMKHGTLARR
jgi:hypothetical protein